jgi:hypothetical protein
MFSASLRTGTTIETVAAAWSVKDKSTTHGSGLAGGRTGGASVDGSLLWGLRLSGNLFAISRRIAVPISQTCDTVAQMAGAMHHRGAAGGKILP